METLNVWGILSRGLQSIANRFYNGAQDNLAVFMQEDGPNNDQVKVDDQNSTDTNNENDNLSCDTVIDDNKDVAKNDAHIMQTADEQNDQISDEKRKKYSLRSKGDELSNNDDEMSNKDDDISNKDEKMNKKDHNLSNEDSEMNNEDEKLCTEDDKMSNKDGDLSDEDLSDEDDEMSNKDNDLSDECNGMSNKSDDLSNEDDEMSSKDGDGSDVDDHSDEDDEHINGDDDHCNGVDNHDIMNEEQKECIENEECTENHFEMQDTYENGIDLANLSELCRGIVVPVREVQEELNNIGAESDNELQSDSDDDEKAKYSLRTDNVVRGICNAIKEYGDVTLKDGEECFLRGQHECIQNTKRSSIEVDTQCGSSKDTDSNENEDSKGLSGNDQAQAHPENTSEPQDEEVTSTSNKTGKENDTDDPIASITLNFKKKLQKLQDDALNKSLSELKSGGRKAKSEECVQEEVKARDQQEIDTNQEETEGSGELVDNMNLSVRDSGEFTKYIEITDLLNNSKGEVVRMNTPIKAKVPVETEDVNSENEDELTSKCHEADTLDEESSPAESDVFVPDEMANKEEDEDIATSDEVCKDCPSDSDPNKADIIDTNDNGSKDSGQSVDFSIHPPENILKNTARNRNTDSDEDEEFVVSRKRIKKSSEVVGSKFTCDECGKSFQRQSNFTVHLNKYHPSYSDDENTYMEEFCCKFCTRSFKKIGFLDRHIRLKHT